MKNYKYFIITLLLICLYQTNVLANNIPEYIIFQGSNDLADSYNYKHMLKGIEMIPRPLMQSFIDNGGVIVFTSSGIDTKTNTKITTIGKYEFYYDGKEINENIYDRKIYILNATSSYRAIVHEMGHYLDECNDSISKTKEFNKIYNTYAKSINNYAASSSQECFAEIFKIYIFNPHYLVQNYPELYNYMSTCVNIN